MKEILFSISFAPVLYMSGTLSLAPFKKLLTRKQVGLLHGFYAVFLVVTACIFYATAISGRATFALVKHALLIWCLLASLLNGYLLPQHFRECIFSSALATLFHYLIGAVATYLVNVSYGWNSIEAYTRMELLSCVLIGLCYAPIRSLIVSTVRPFLAYSDLVYWRTIYLIPVAMLLACYFMLPGNMHMATLSQVFGRLFMVLLAFFICRSISADYLYFQEKQEIKDQLLQQKAHYSSMQVTFEKARRQRHDLKHHLVTIQHYIETDNKEGLRSYCGEMLLQTELQNPLPYSGNSAADGVIYHYMQKSAQQDTQFTFQGTLHCDGIADTDLCVLLGNALDNALTACQTIPEGRFVRVTALSEPQLLSILIQNSFDGVINEQEDTILSRKRQNRTGVGLRSMDMVCQNYGGMIDRSWDEGTFTLCIHLPLGADSVTPPARKSDFCTSRRYNTFHAGQRAGRNVIWYTLSVLMAGGVHDRPKK